MNNSDNRRVRIDRFWKLLGVPMVSYTEIKNDGTLAANIVTMDVFIRIFKNES